MNNRKTFWNLFFITVFIIIIFLISYTYNLILHSYLDYINGVKKQLKRYEIVRLNLLEQCQRKFAPIKNSVILVQKVAKLKLLYASLSSTCKNYYETNHVPSSSFEKQIHNLND